MFDEKVEVKPVIKVNNGLPSEEKVEAATKRVLAIRDQVFKESDPEKAALVFRAIIQICFGVTL